MQTFVPSADIRAAVGELDSRRLGKQRVETLQILRALTWTTYGWRHHPAVRMWRGFPRALAAYGVAVCDEWTSRGGADAVRPLLLEFAGGEPDLRELRAGGELPPWIGRPALHASHRSALLRKDPEHYRALYGDEPDDLPYVWPAPVFPTWPVRRPGPDPLPLAAALGVLGLAEATAGQEAAVREVSAGRSHRVTAVPGEDASTAGLLAGLCTPGETLWIVPGPVPPVPGPPPRLWQGEVPARRLSPSVARAPTDEDRASVAREAADGPDYRFLRARQVAAARAGGRLRAVGLVVVETDAGHVPDLGVPVLELACDCRGAG